MLRVKFYPLGKPEWRQETSASAQLCHLAPRFLLSTPWRDSLFLDVPFSTLTSNSDTTVPAEACRIQGPDLTLSGLCQKVTLNSLYFSKWLLALPRPWLLRCRLRLTEGSPCSEATEQQFTCFSPIKNRSICYYESFVDMRITFRGRSSVTCQSLRN